MFLNTNFSEQDNKIVLHIDLPGVKKEDILIQVKGDTLFINAKREKPEGLIRAESFYGDLKKSFKLNMFYEDIQSSFQNGVLEIHIIKSEKEIPKKIEIKWYNKIYKLYKEFYESKEARIFFFVFFNEKKPTKIQTKT